MALAVATAVLETSIMAHLKEHGGDGDGSEDDATESLGVGSATDEELIEAGGVSVAAGTSMLRLLLSQAVQWAAPTTPTPTTSGTDTSGVAAPTAVASPTTATAAAAAIGGPISAALAASVRACYIDTLSEELEEGALTVLSSPASSIPTSPSSPEGGSSTAPTDAATLIAVNAFVDSALAGVEAALLQGGGHVAGSSRGSSALPVVGGWGGDVGEGGRGGRGKQ